MSEGWCASSCGGTCPHSWPCSGTSCGGKSSSSEQRGPPVGQQQGLLRDHQQPQRAQAPPGTEPGEHEQGDGSHTGTEHHCGGQTGRSQPHGEGASAACPLPRPQEWEGLVILPAAAITPQALRFPDWTESWSPTGLVVAFLREGTLCGVTGVPVDVAVPSWRVSVPAISPGIQQLGSGH